MTEVQRNEEEVMSGRVMVRGAVMVAVAIAWFVFERSAAAEPKGGYESEQGTLLSGTKNSKLEDAAILYKPSATPQASYRSLRVEAGELRMVLPDGTEIAGKALANRELTIVPPVATLLIREVRPHVNIYDGEPTSMWEYDVVVQNGAQQTRLCDEAKNAALVVPGIWKETQLLPKAPDRFRFSCVPILVPDSAPVTAEQRAALFTTHRATFTPEERKLLPANVARQARWRGGVAAKCIDYGYAPWLGGVAALGKITKGGGKIAPRTEAAAQAFHNVCTQAMRADYGGNGQSHTIPGTTILIFDLTNLPVCELTSPPPSFCEAAVSAPGPAAASVPVPASRQDKVALHGSPTSPSVAQPKRVEDAVARFREVASSKIGGFYYEAAWTVDDGGNAHALCVSRARWKTIDARGLVEHTDHLDKGGGRYCEDGSLAVLSAHQSVLVTYSPINEKGLWRFNLAKDFKTAPRWITTTHVKWRLHVTMTPHGKVTTDDFEPGAGIYCERTPCFAHRFEGDVLSRSVPADAHDGFDLIPLNLYRNAHGDYATATKPPVGYQPVHFPEELPSATPPHVSTPEVSAAPSEGYLFIPAPTLPEATSSRETGARATGLQLLKQGGVYCTTRTTCDNYDHPQALGYVLLPNAAAELDIRTPIPVRDRPQLGDPATESPAQKRGPTQQPAKVVPQAAPR